MNPRYVVSGDVRAGAAPGHGSSKGRRRRSRFAPATAPIRGAEGGRPTDARSRTDAVLGAIERGVPAPEIDGLVQAARGGDELAFAELYVRFFDRVYRYLLVALKNPDDAQEVAQDAFARALSSLERYDTERGNFRDWLFSMVRSLAIDHLRRGSRTRSVDPERMPGPAASVAQRASTLLEGLDPDAGVRGLIGELPAQQQRVLALRFVFELSNAEIAEVTDMTPEAVRQAQHRALKTLAAAAPSRVPAAH